MAPPRLQCLNASRQVMRRGVGMKAMFSTSQSSKADDPPRPSAAADLLASIGDSDSSPSRPPPGVGPDPYANSFKLPISKRKPPNRGNSATNSGVARLIENQSRKEAARNAQRGPGQLSLSSSEELARHKRGQDLNKQIPRRWKEGDIYAPHDLSEVEMSKWRNRGRPLNDVFDVLNIKPMEHYRNFSIMSEYMTPMGRIKHSNETGLRPVNQRRIARAIRRSIGLGIMPSVHRHPEILQKIAVRNEGVTRI